MHNVIKLCLKYVFLISVIINAFWVGYDTYASEVKSNNDLKGLTVSPLRSEFEVKPGSSYSGELTITNSTDKNMEVRLNAETFSVINQRYDYAFASESNVANWINFSALELSLSPQESRNVNYNVGVPISAEPGGRYIGLFATNDIQSADGKVNTRQRIASFLYFTVLGKVSRVGSLVSLNSPWLINNDSSWSAVVRNSGTTHYRSRYDVKVENIVTGDLITSKSGDSLILPGTVRLISDNLPKFNIPGIYKLEYVIGLGDSPSKTETRYAVYCPYWLMVCLLIVMVLLIRRIYKIAVKKQKT